MAISLTLRDCLRCFDHGPEVDLVIAADSRDSRVELPNFVSTVHLRHNDCRRFRCNDHKVGVMPLGADPIDPNRDFSIAVLTGLGSCADPRASLLLRVRSDSVFKVKD